MNWLQAPFNNAKVRPGRLHGARQQDFLEAVVGDPQYWRTCKALFTCGSPLATEVGMDGLFEGNAEKAQADAAEAGYDGTPIVLLQSSDLAVLTNLAPVAKGLLERAGFKVDMQTYGLAEPGQPRDHQERAAVGRRLERLCTSWVQLTFSIR